MADQLTIVWPRGVTRGLDVDALVTEWHEYLALKVGAQELAQATRSSYIRGMDRFIAWCAKEDRSRIGPGAIRSWKATLVREGYKPGSVNTWFAGVKSFFAWAVAEKGLAHNPTAGVRGASRRGTTRRHKRDCLSDQEVLRVLSQSDTNKPAGLRDKAILSVMAYTAARTIEVQRANVGNLRTNGGGLLKLSVQGKGRSEADEELVVAHPDAAAALYDWLALHPDGDNPDAPLFVALGNRSKGRRLSTRAIRRIVKTHFRAAGIRDPRKTAHSLRHSAISNALRHGTPLHKVQAMSRHRSLDTLLIYVHELDRDADPAEAHIDYGTGK